MLGRDTSQGAVNGRIDAILNDQCVPRLITAYYDPDGPFAGATFDTLGQNPRDTFVVDDLLAVTLLDVRVRPPAIRRILGTDADELGALLSKVPDVIDLWDATEPDLTAADALWQRLKRYSWLSSVTAGKLLARKRPRLTPVMDSVVEEAIGAPDQGYWNAYKGALSDAGRREHLSALRPGGLDERVSDLRILDVAIWMRRSRGTSAINARREAGCDGEP